MDTANENCPSSALGFNFGDAEIKARDIACGNINGQNIQVYNCHSISGPARSSDNIVTEVIYWLSPHSVDYFPTHEKARSQRAEHTGKWVFNTMKYKLWATVGFGKYRNLECVGIPGAGKTTMAATVVKSLQDSFLAKRGLDIVLYAYFRHDTQATQTIPLVLASLLLQVIKHKRKVSTHMRKFYEDYSSRKDMSPSTDIMVTLLQSELSGFGRAYIVVDALDEFTLPDYSLSWPLVDVLQRLNARLLITSRYPVNFAPNTSLKILVSAHADDIRVFVRKHLSGHLTTVVAGTPGLLDEIVNAVIMKSAGMFMVATLLVSCIPTSRSLTANDLRAAVKELPTGIDDTYHLAITRIQSQEPHLAELGTQALYWVYHSKRHLTVIELRHALSFQRSNVISKDDLISEDRILSSCAGLISFVKRKDKQKTVECQFSHFTTREFLDKSGRKYLLNGERQVMEMCLRYLVTAASGIPSNFTKGAQLGPQSQDRVNNTTWKQFGDDHGLALCAYAVDYLGFTPSTFSTLRDIYMFVQGYLSDHLAAVIAGTPGLLEEIVHTVVIKSAGIFVVATLLVNCIPKFEALTADELRAMVKNLPSGIQGTYEMLINRIWGQEPYLAGLGMDALAWVYFSKRRLTITELRHALSFQRSKVISKYLIDEDQILSACAGLISFVKLKLKRKTVECQISSVMRREFLDKSWQKYLPDGERQITETCLGYLAAVLSGVPPGVTKAAQRDYLSSHLIWRKHCQDHGFALSTYAAEYWGNHAKAIGEAIDLDAVASYFKHPLSPYTAAEDTTLIYPTDSMPPERYWTLYFARFGLLELLQKHSDAAFSIQSDDGSQKVLVKYDDIRDRSGWTALHFSALGGHSIVVEFLLDSGANVNVLDDDRESPLHFAVQAGSSGFRMVQLLLSRGAVVDQPDDWDRAPVFYAIEPSWTSNAPSVNIIGLLLQHEVNIHRIDKLSTTPLSLAQESENPKIKQLLEEYASTHPPHIDNSFTKDRWGSPDHRDTHLAVSYKFF